MPDISPQEIKWTVASVAVILAVAAMGFGVGGDGGVDQVPQIETDNINTEFFNAEVPTRPQRGNIEGIIPVPNYDPDQNNENSRSIYASSGASPNYEILLTVNNRDGDSIDVTALYGVQEKDTGFFGSEEIRIIDQQSVEFNQTGQTFNSSIDSADGTWAFESTLKENDEGGLYVSYNSQSTPITSGPISAVVDALVYGINWLQYGLLWIINTFVSVVTGVFVFVSFVFDLIVYVIAAFTALMNLHPLLAIIFLLPVLIVTITASKVAIMLLELVPM